MEESDAITGFWVKDMPYKFESALSIEKCSRIYNTNPNVIIDPSCSWVPNYFKYESWYQKIPGYFYNAAPKMYKNGRLCYATENDPVEKIVKLPQRRFSELAESLHSFSDQEYNLYSLICNQMVNGSLVLKWDDVLDVMKDCPPISNCDPCTIVGTKMAKSLIKIASLRIFANPEQSVMELPVNSLDSYNPERKIGKFGMGFFSIFYWLIGHPKRIMTIHSFYKDDNGIFVTYRVEIREVDGNLSFSLTTYPYSKIEDTGFRVFIDAKDDKFDYANTTEFYNQLNKLRYASGAAINIASNVEWWNFTGKEEIGQVASPNKIYCSINKDHLLFEDYASGVPLEILFGSLFVPSISTKTIQMSQKLQWTREEPEILSQGILSTLLFLVGGIGVVSITDDTSSNKTYLLKLPPNTRLPVSRDDIILSDETKDIITESIKKLFALERTNVSTLQNLIEKYIDYTSNDENKDLFKRCLKDFYLQNINKLVPSEHKALYSLINDSFIVSNVYDPLSIEKWMDENMNPDTKIWCGVKVVYVDTKGQYMKISNGGLPNMIFIDKETVKRSNWISSVTTSYMQTKLYPLNSKYGEEQFDKYEKWGKKIDQPRLRNLFFSVLNKYESLYIYFKLDVQKNSLADSLLVLYTNLGEKVCLNIYSKLLSKMATFIGNQTYGGAQNNLIVPNIVDQQVTRETKNSVLGKKSVSYLEEHISLVIEAIEENAMTKLYIISNTSPWNLTKESSNPVYSYFCSKVAEYSLNFSEFSLVLFGAGSAFTDAPETMLYNLIDHLAYYSVDKIRNRGFVRRDVLGLYKIWKNERPYSATTYSYLIQDKAQMRDRIKIAQGINTIPTYSSLKIPSGSASVKLSSLIRKLFRKNLPENNLMDFFTNMPSEGANMQIIEIAVNEGTTKPFIEAFLTEIFQNSVDAIREFNPKKKEIDIILAKTDNDIIIKVIDYVGMTENSFIYAGIPFLSTKTPSELVTGEMGSGFLNVYRNSSQVRIESVKDGILRSSIDFPIRENGRVIDVDKHISVQETKSPNQTSISVIIPYSSPDEFSNMVSKTLVFCKNVLPLSLHNSISFNGQVENMNKTLSYRQGFFEIYTLDTAKDMNSYLLTKGIPFVPLEDYLKSYLSVNTATSIRTNLIVNILHGGYTPVQTRTKLQLPPNFEKEFKEFIYALIFVGAVSAVYHKHTTYLDHMNSSADLDQLLFSTYTVVGEDVKIVSPNAVLKYYPFLNQISIAKLINSCISLGPTIKNGNNLQEHLEKTWKTPYENINTMVYGIVKRWFLHKKFKQDNKKGDTKTVNVKLTIPKLKELLKAKGLKVSGTKQELLDRLEKAGIVEEDKPKKTEIDKELTGLIQSFVTLYWTAASKIGIKGYSGKAPTVEAGKSEADKNVKGFYTKYNHSIFINALYWTKKDRDNLVNLLLKRKEEVFENDLLKNKEWFDSFAYRFPSSTVIHELEHARRKMEHSQGSHDGVYHTLYAGDTVTNRTFDQAANAVYQKVLEDGFYNKLVKTI